MRTLLAAAVLAAAALLPVPAAGAGNPVAADNAPSVVATIPIPVDRLYDLAWGIDAVWVVNLTQDAYSSLRRIDPATNRVTATHLLDSAALGLAVGAGSVWIAMPYDNIVERLDPMARVRARISVGLQPSFLDVAFGSVWVANHHGRSVSRIDPRTDRVIATLPAGDQATFRDGPQGFADDGHYLYLYSSNGTRPFERIDPRTDKVRTYPLDGTALCDGVPAAVAGSVLVPTCGPSLRQVAAATGTLTRSVALPSQVPRTPSLADSAGRLWVAFDTAYDNTTGVASGGTLAEISPAPARSPSNCRSAATPRPCAPRRTTCGYWTAPTG